MSFRPHIVPGPWPPRQGLRSPSGAPGKGGRGWWTRSTPGSRCRWARTPPARSSRGRPPKVEAHLATCAACRAEAGQLGRAAAWLGAGQDLAPPEETLRDVLAAARAHPAGNGEATGPPAEAGPAAKALAATADLDELLAEQAPTVAAAGDPRLGRGRAAPAPGRRPASGDGGPGRRAAPGVRDLDHADDLRRARAARPARQAPITSTASWPWACGCCRRPAHRRRRVPAAPSRCAWRAGGGTWTVPLPGTGPPAATVTAPATEFFYLMGNRRDPAAVATAVTGDRALAAGLLRAAATLGCD